MKYIGENAIKKLISLIKGDLATKQDSIAATGVLERDTTGVINGVETVGATLVETQEATLVDVPNGLLKGDGTTISAAVAGTDYVNSSQAIRYDAAQSLTDEQKAQARGNIGAAPSGYGFGGEYISRCTATSSDETYESFCTRLDEIMAGMPSNSVRIMVVYPPQIYGLVSNTCSLVYQNADGYCGVYNLGTPDPLCSQWRMIKFNSVWQPFEWVNPPMKLGEEYRTTERYLGKPVYTMAINTGSLGNNTVDDIPHNIANIDAIWVSGGSFVQSNNDKYSVPYFGGTENHQVFVSANRSKVHRTHKGDVYSITDMVVILKYTKYTD